MAKFYRLKNYFRVYNKIMTEIKRFQFLVAVHCFFIKDQQLLLLKRAQTGYKDGYWSVPAGHVDGHESIAEAAARESQEEVVLKIKVDQPQHVMHRICSPNEERIDFFYLIKDWSGSPIVAEPEKSSAVEFFALDNLPEKMVPYVRYALGQTLAGKSFSEFIEG